jgi:hypothetical protein
MDEASLPNVLPPGRENLTPAITTPLSSLNVVAQFVMLTTSPKRYDVYKNDCKSGFFIGRQPSCHIVLHDKRISRKHIRVYMHELSKDMLIEVLSAVGLFLNDTFVRKSETRVLRHGDHISLSNKTDSRKTSDSPLFLFCQVSFGEENALISSLVEEQPALPCRPLDANFVSQDWINKTWDMSSLIGKGYFSQVCLGIHVVSKQQVAVKVIEKSRFLEFRSKRKSTLHVRSEVQMLLSLRHPGIVRCKEWFETTHQTFIIMDLLPNDLLQMILSQSNFPERQCKRFFYKSLMLFPTSTVII